LAIGNMLLKVFDGAQEKRNPHLQHLTQAHTGISVTDTGVTIQSSMVQREF